MTAFKDMAGKVAVVTGAASGIGKGIARKLKAEGMQLVIADIERGALDEAASELGAVGVLTDVSDYGAVEALAEETVRRFGAVHLICNNAGVGSNAKVADMTLSDWRWIIGVNLWGVIHGVQAFLPRLLANPDGGHIVNTASMSGFRAVPTLGGYTVTKYGVVALSETLAIELAANGAKVGVTVLCPGPVRSNIKTASRNRPASLAGGGLVDKDLAADPVYADMRWVDADDAGDVVVRAVKRGDLYALTHPEMAPAAKERFDDILAAFEAAAAD
jgi:NAD(P)-dependent dehydrogenase (short-subunit alcohol dehydrogenase family)